MIVKVAVISGEIHWLADRDRFCVNIFHVIVSVSQSLADAMVIALRRYTGDRLHKARTGCHRYQTLLDESTAEAG
ncbi:hypothetical protein QN239_32225 [Mycolicibacterium sp. Y3]